MKATFFKGVVLGALTSTLVLAAAAAMAGTGIGGIFNLGQANTVDATSTLSGTVDDSPQLSVRNDGTGDAGRSFSAGGRGLLGQHTGTTGTLPGVEGATRSTDPNTVALLGRLPVDADSSAVAVKGIGSTGTGVYGFGRRGVIGSSTSGTGVVGTSGGYGVEGYGSTGVYGKSQDGQGVFGSSVDGAGVSAFSETDNGLFARSHATAPGTAAIRAENFSGVAASLWGRVEMTGDLEFTGSSTAQQHKIVGDYGKCPLGTVAAAAKVNASSTFSGSFVDIADSFDCDHNGSEGTVKARRLGVGDYEVYVSGLGSKALAVGNVRSYNEDDYLMIEEGTSSLGRVFRVRIRDDDDTYDDVPFSIVVVPY